MSRTVYASLLIAALLLATTVFSPAAHAQSNRSLRSASDRYREAVLGFERHVYRAGYFDHYAKRLADRLEDISGEFRSAAHNPGDVPRLLYHWTDLTTTQARVDATLVRGCSRPDPELLRCWEPVLIAYNCLVEEMNGYTTGHQHPHLSGRSPVTPYPVVPQYNGFPQGGFPQGGIGYGGQTGFDQNYNFLPQGFPPSGFDPNPPAVQFRPNTPPFTGSRGAQQVDPRREIGAAIAATLLNRLLNQ